MAPKELVSVTVVLGLPHQVSKSFSSLQGSHVSFAKFTNLCSYSSLAGFCGAHKLWLYDVVFLVNKSTL